MQKTKRSRYKAEIGGHSWAQGPAAEFPTIRECREWAEEYGTTADYCHIYDSLGRLVAEHRRNPNSPGGWFRATV